jgi:hypothetical protein
LCGKGEFRRSLNPVPRQRPRPSSACLWHAVVVTSLSRFCPVSGMYTDLPQGSPRKAQHLIPNPRNESNIQTFRPHAQRTHPHSHRATSITSIRRIGTLKSLRCKLTYKLHRSRQLLLGNGFLSRWRFGYTDGDSWITRSVTDEVLLL